MPNIVYIAASLDGFIARADGSIDWLTEIPNPEHSDYGFAVFMDRIDAIVMGRNTFEQVLKFGTWPYSKPVFVLSRTIKKVPGELTGKVRIIEGDTGSIIEKLNSSGFRNLYIDGGKTIREFLYHGLIDELIITTIPVILGEGIRLFGKVPDEQKFEFVNTEVYDDMLVKNHYRKK